MTHQNHQTNGASLEDCHTNFFALTDLCGIKWRKFVNGERVSASSDPLDDPILRSYSRCMQADILCVWRRIQSTKQENSDPNALYEISSSKVHPPLSLAAAKELWIFWYGEEPDLTELVDAELLKVAANQALWNGTWERGLTYECRSLLFKALHNLMERFVLTKDIVRFGKWFVQPCTSNDRLFGRSSQHLSFSFTFFVHGDTVCASIDLREHPAVRPLTKEHLKEAAAAFAAATNSQTLSQSHEQHGNTTNLPEDVASSHITNNGGLSSNSPNATPLPKPRRVILAPFGMAATLTGNSFKATDPMAEKILEDWASFFPLCNKENSDVPPVVEVVSGGHKMYHPSIYVLVTDLDDMEEMEAAALQKDALGTTSSAEAAALTAISSANSNEQTGVSRKLPTNHSSAMQQPQQIQQQQQVHTMTTVTTTVATTSSSPSGGAGGNVAQNNSGVGGNSSIAMVEQRLHELQVRTQPYYDTTASSFTGNTTNTHASPQAATEMPERVWQDCITNTLHVAYAASVASNTVMGTGVSMGTATAGSSISSTTLPTTTHSGVSGTTTVSGGGGNGEDCNSTSGNNNGGSSDNNSGNVCTAMDTHNANTNTTNDVKDIKDINGIEAKLRIQQLQFWGFVDPMEKAPCTCTNAPGPGLSLRLCNNSNTMMTFGCKMHTGTTGCSTTNHSHHNHPQQQQQQHQQQYQPHQHQYNLNLPSTLLSPSSSSSCSIVKGASSSRTSMRIPFHRRQQFDFNFDSDGNTTGGRQNFSTNTSSSTAKCQKADSVGGGGSDGVCYDFVIIDNGGAVDTVDSASAAASNSITTMMHYKTSDTIPKPRTLNPASMTPHDTPHGGASTYSRNSVGDLMPIPSVGSPGTPAQSPHPNSTLSQPTSVPPAEQLLTMSPRAPPSVPNLQQPSTPIDHLLDKNTPAPTPTDQHDNKSITTSPYVRPTPSVEPPPSVEGGNGGGGGMSNLGPNGPGSVQQPPSVGRCTPTITNQQQTQQQPQPAQPQMLTNVTGSAVGPQCGTITIKKFDLHQPPLTPLNPDQIKTEPGYVAATSVVNTCNRNGMPIVSMASTISTAEAISDYWKTFKTPDIKVKDIDSFANDDCSKFDVLYDFTFQNAWANHPMERFKPNETTKPRSMSTKNLYEGHTHSKPLMPSPGSLYGSQLLSIDASLNPLCDSSMNGSASVGGNASGGLVGIAAHGTGPLKNANNTSAAGTDRNTNASGYFHNLDIQTTDTIQGTASPCKEGKSSASGNLYTAEGLNPSMNDLEQLFETSNDDCGSVQIHTPPDSNNPSSETTSTTTIDDLKRNSAAVTAGAVTMASLQNCNNTSNSTNNPLVNNTNSSNNGSGNGGAGMIQAEDLTKMFPTPPSHEQHHPNSSPCQMDIQMTDLSVITASTTMSASLETTSIGGGIMKIKQEYSVELGSPVEEPIEDWSYVYRPPKRAKFVGSSKYAPLTNLPSQTLPPLTLPHTFKYKPSWTTQKSRAVVAAQAAAVQQQQQLQQQQLQQQHQQLHELLSAPRTPLQQPRTPLGPIPSPMHSSTVATPLNSGGGGAGGGSNNLLLNQLNCPQAALTNNPGSATMQHLMQRAGMSPISPNPTSVVSFPMMQQPQRHPPPPYEMAVASPATSTSSYLNKQYHSQEHPPTPQSVGMPSTHLPRPLSAAGNLMTAGGGATTATAVARELPEVSSLIVNILLYDTALNVFRDHNFDSSTVCVCNADAQKVDIRGADSGVYVPLPGGSFNPLPPTANVNNIIGVGGVTGSGGGVNMRLLSAFGGGWGGTGSTLDSPASQPGTSGHTASGSSSASATPANNNQHITGYVDDDPIECTCGFSAVVNRRLAFRAGLFYEDEMEITGVAEDPGRNKKQSLPALITNLATALTPSASSGSLLDGTTALVPNKGRNSIVPAQQTEKGRSNNVQPDAQALQSAHMIFDLLLEQCSIIQTSSSSIHRALQRHRHRLARQSRQPQSVVAIANVLEFVDTNDVMCLALEQARLAFESNRMDINEFAGQHQLSPFHTATGSGVVRRNHQHLLNSRLTVHKWPYIPVGFTRSNKEIVRTMNFIQPMLQNAFHSKSRSAAGSKDATYTVSGPLTWRQFHRLAGRASGQCEPQPIPSVIVGHDKDWVSVAPLAIHYWDKFLLEPYGYARDIVYLVVCPENDFVVDNTRKYFRELSSTYEMCKLGHHTPIRGWDGLLTIGPRTPTDNTTASNTPLDDWLRTLDDSTLAEKIRLYANAFHNQIAPYLNRVPGDKTLLNPPENSSCQPGAGRERGTTSPMGSSTNTMHGGVSGGDGDKAHSSPQKMESVEPQQQQQQQQSTTEPADIKPDIKADSKPPIVLSDPLGMADTLEDINPPAIVLYVVEPFTFGSDSPELERLACIALLRCYAELLKSIPDSVRANMHIQMISLESIVELGRSRSRKRFSDEVRCLALNIFSQCRRHLLHTQAVKSLTGFGTAANMETFLKSKDEKNRQPYKMYTPPYVLAPMHEKNDRSDFSRQSASMRALNEQKYSVMYCNYCLSEDQSWLLATVTDDRGEMFEKIIINIDVPNRTRRRKAPARRVGLKKLMDFIMGLISQTTHPWRLVVGRIGRIGHSELKSWSSLLSKQNLQKASKQLKDCCKQCSLMYPPGILSACLVTLEPDSKLRVMPDQFTPDERFSQISMQNPLSTPQDVTCTHILVFPTSAVCLSFTRQFQNEPQVDLENDFLNFDEEDENEGFADLGDLLLWDPQPGRMSNHCSPEPDENRSWQSASGNNFNSTQQQDVEEVGSINQQPLAVGYMVSTAPTGRMPSWFWSACPHLEDVCPVFLKTALHLHVPNIQTTDDILNSTNAHSSATDHPLDSSLTADVLRFVLEGYNALSWLALDSNTHDRLSCLPINVQMLMDLYYLAAAIM